MLAGWPVFLAPPFSNCLLISQTHDDSEARSSSEGIAHTTRERERERVMPDEWKFVSGPLGKIRCETVWAAKMSNFSSECSDKNKGCFFILNSKIFGQKVVRNLKAM